jgi:hypothetical protein
MRLSPSLSVVLSVVLTVLVFSLGVEGGRRTPPKSCSADLVDNRCFPKAENVRVSAVESAEKKKERNRERERGEERENDRER